ncbi:MAG TPA: D-alanyl-D-alanine carboxypeptidase/D-alanyl-D-alanine-endopeptidase [Microlunatus sp.]|nr:D-alanyl-D-alanine carboxypeptidase/D-alanyl-D-alanine-endopeptidase [Microlunatus sp.]
MQGRRLSGSVRRRWVARVAGGGLRTALVAAILGGLALAGPAGPVSPAFAAVNDPALARKLGSVLADSRVSKARTAAAVYDIALGAEVYGYQPARATTPASNTKIVTAIAAMHVLGPNYRFKTEAIRRGRIVNGEVQGRLYLKGYGDPTARVSDYTSLARQIAARGIRRFSGNLAVDASYFDAQRYNPNWSTSYASAYYAAQTSALTVAPNADYDSGTIYVSYRPGSKGKKARIGISPAAAASVVTIVNNTTSGGSSNTIRVGRKYGTNTITVSGTIPTNRGVTSVQITVDRPELYAGAVLRAELLKVGVRVHGPTVIATTPASGRTVLGTDTSMKLSSMLKPFLKYSNNMHAEALTKAMSRKTGGPGSWPDGIAQTKAYLKSLGAPMDGIVLVDGSGLSRATKLTPRALTRALAAVRKESWFGQFYAALPVAGNTNRSIGGTLRFRMNGTRAANNAHAKTGSLTGVTALSGYVTGRNGHLYVFSMLSQYSRTSPRPVENTLVITLANWNG